MEEGLKAASLYHGLLVIAAAAGLVFGMTPNEKPFLDAALAELNELLALDLQELGQSAFNAHKDVQSYRKTLADIAREVEMPRKHDDDIKTFPLAFEFKVPDERTSLDRLTSFIEKQHVVSQYIPLPVPGDLGELKENLTGLPFAKISTIELPQAPNPEKPNLHYVRVSANGRLQTHIERFLFGNATIDVTVHPLKMIADQHTMSTLRGEFPDVKLLPTLRGRWVEYGALTAKEAYDKIGRRRAESHDNIVLLNFSIPGNAVAALVPAIVCLLLVYFFLHVRHLAKMAEVESVLAQGKKAFWIVLFPDCLSKTVTMASITLLPVVSSILVLVRSWPAAESVYLCVGILFTAIAATVAYGSARETAILNGRFNSERRASDLTSA